MAQPLKCDLCDKQATVHLTQIINNQIHKVDLCESCAEEKGITDASGYSLADLLVKPQDGQEAVAGGSLECSSCGFTQKEFKNTGRLGCLECYDAFSTLIEPALDGMHRGERHKGKVPQRAVARKSYQDRLHNLETDLSDAISSERYEDAARFRDEIIALRKSLEEKEES